MPSIIQTPTTRNNFWETVIFFEITICLLNSGFRLASLPQIDTGCFGISHHSHSWGHFFFLVRGLLKGFKKQVRLSKLPTCCREIYCVTVSQQNLVSVTFSVPCFHENYNTPLEYTPGNPPSQLWKESLYSLLAKVWGCVPKVWWNNLRLLVSIYLALHYPLNPLHRNSHPPIALQLRHPSCSLQ